MTNSKILYDNLIRDLNLTEPEDEISAIAFEVLNHFGISKTEILAQKRIDFSYERLLPLITRLNNHEPVQYVLGTAWFCGHQFLVNPSVLIPRPETELIVEEALKIEFPGNNFSILDIGTGSGCIAISLALAFPEAHVTAIDVSEDALKTAQLNAKNLHATKVDFRKIDILQEELLDRSFDLIVSNPPYISEEDKNSIPQNVLNYEPHLALFIKNDDPTIFYKAIGMQTIKSLRNEGHLIVEINPLYVDQITKWFGGLQIFKSLKVIKDFSGSDRFIVLRK